MKTIAAIVAACLAVQCTALAAEKDADVGATPVTIIVVDACGASVSKALIGTQLRNMNALSGKDELKFERMVRSKTPLTNGPPNGIATDILEPAVADDNGRAELALEELVLVGLTAPQPVVAMSADREQMGVVLVPTDGSASEVRVVIQPLIERTIHCRCPVVNEAKAEYSILSFRLPQGLPFLTHCSTDATYTVKLPAGNYRLQASTRHADPKMQDIEFGKDEADVEIELNPKQLLSLVGKPAPDLVEIKDWLGGDPVTLNELKGKVVLLDFFGYWCGPCISRMPHLFDLHDEFHESGLVILGIHDDSVKDLDELSELLAPHPKGVWNGRTLPFTIAIDGGGDQQIAGRDHVIRGKTTAAYGVASWPTYILIDRKGIVRGSFLPTDPADRKLLQSLLDEKP